MSRLAVGGVAAAAVLAGFVAGRVSGAGSTHTVTVQTTVEHPVVIDARYVGSARDARGRGPLDLVRVRSVRESVDLVTTIVAGAAWRDGLLRHDGADGLTILYDTNGDGKVDRRDVVFRFRGRLMSWISQHRQGVWGADVTRRSGTTITVSRDARLFFDASGEGERLWTQPIGVAVVARWPHGGDRVPDRGWIVAPPPATS